MEWQWFSRLRGGGESRKEQKRHGMPAWLASTTKVIGLPEHLHAGEGQKSSQGMA